MKHANDNIPVLKPITLEIRELRFSPEDLFYIEELKRTGEWDKL